MVAEGELGFNPVFDRGESQFLQTGDFGSQGRLPAQVAVGLAKPEIQTLLEQGQGSSGIGRCELSALVDRLLEVERIEGRGVCLHAVAVTLTGDPFAEHGTEMRHITVKGRLGGVRWLTCPDRLDESVTGDDAIGTRQEDGQDHSLASPTESEALSILDRSERAEDPVLHASHARDTRFVVRRFGHVFQSSVWGL